MQFGSGTGFENVSGSMVDPSSVALKRHGRTHISDVTFDPTRLTNTDKMKRARTKKEEEEKNLK